MVADLARTASAQEEFAEAPPWLRIAHLTRDAVRRWAATDLARLSLWTPAAIGLGAGIYFGLKTEPDAAPALIILIIATLYAVFFERYRRIAAALALIALGFAAADWRTARVAAPQLTRDLGIVAVSGKLISVDEGARQRRYVLALDTISGVAPEDLPARARITWRGEGFDARPGDRISVRAGLSPPPPPVAPGNFDFARQLYFLKIGAVGYAVTAPVINPPTDKTWTQSFSAGIEEMRLALAARIIHQAPGQGGAILAAIVTGKRGAISVGSENALRDAGLAHLLAISGLHMGLATGLVFFAVRFALAAIEPLALHFPIKKWAAAAALASGFFYLILSGGGWSARRAFIMAAIMFAAILVDRRALSLRNVAIAATIILLTTPEALFSPGFQMSFAAVTALIAAYEWWTARRAQWADQNLFSKLHRYLVMLGVTDTVSALATAPYALFHFNRVAIYSLAANMAAMPLMGFFIVPFAVIALALAPLGLDGWAWRCAASGMDQVLAIASSVSGLQGAVSITPQWPLAAMLALTAGGLWLCLSRAPWRIAGLAAIPVAALMVLGARPPVLFVSPTGLNGGVIAENPDGEKALYVHAPRREKFAALMWEEAAGFDPESARPGGLKEIFACDEYGCAGEVSDRASVITSFVTDRASLAEDCRRARIVVALFPASEADWRRCDAFLIDRRSAWRRGAHAIWIERDGSLRVKTVSEVRGKRPWTGGG